MKNNQITLNLTDSEVERLTKLIYAGSWLINAIHVPGEGHTDIENVESIAYSALLKSGAADDLLKIDDDGNVGPTRTLEESEDVTQYIEDYNEDNFWDELIERMADKELESTRSPEELGSMSQDELLEEYYRISDKYGAEFEKHGMERLVIRED